MSNGRRSLLGAALTALAGVGACTWLLPERFAVNAPMVATVFGFGRGAPVEEESARMRGPAGSSVSIFAEVKGARILEFTEAGDLLVSAPRDNTVWVLSPDRDGDGRADAKRALAVELDRPHGIDVHDGWLYIGEAPRVSRVRFDSATARVKPPLVGLADLPTGGNHWTRNVGVGPDRKLYVTVGSSCNVCEEEDERRAAMLRFELDGSEEEIYASGLRNSVDFDWQPGSGDLYATDNGRDLLGDNFPPCELNRIVRGGFYGWPIANGNRVPDPDFGAGQEERIQASIPPAANFRAHNAPLGMTFVRDQPVPAAYRGAALVALHGSWNRTRKDGYRVVSLHWGADRTIEQRDFLLGFEQDEDVIGRPVDVAVGPEGAFYVSDDYAGVIWRVAPAGAERPTQSLTARAQPAPRNALAALSAEERRGAAERGGALYATHACASCHEAALAEAGVVVKPLLDLASRFDIERLSGFFAAPTPPMPVFELTPDEKRDLAVYVLDRFE